MFEFNVCNSNVMFVIEKLSEFCIIIFCHVDKGKNTMNNLQYN